MGVILKAENISKQYRLGLVGTGTLSHDLNRAWARLRGKEDPYLKVGAVNDRATKAESKYVWALKDINFEVQQGEILGIIGKNGAGKSTLLKLLSRVTSPTTGVIKTKGRIASLLEVGTGFHPELTGKENVFLNGAILGMRKAEIAAKLEEIVQFSGCEKYIDTPVKRYSSGMRVRLAFAVAAHLEPDILVVDEVLAVGDAEFQKKAIGKMQDISRGEGRTVLFVSHNMSSVKTLCTKAILLKNGVIDFEGDTEKAVALYLKNDTVDAKVPLLERKDREGNGKLKIKNVAFYDENKTRITSLISGDPVILKLEIKKIKTVNFKKLTFAVNFRNEFKVNILSFVTDEMNVDFNVLEKQDHFFLKIPRLLLRGQNYTVRVLIFEGNTNKENLVDKLDNTISLQVLPGDFWNTKILNREEYSCLMPADFIFYESQVFK